MSINFSWKFHQKVLTLTISFFVLNDSIEFVPIYRPHPVDDWKSPLHLQAGWNPCPIQQEENLMEVCEEEVCPPSSLDCNPFDYFVWGVSEL